MGVDVHRHAAVMPGRKLEELELVGTHQVDADHDRAGASRFAPAHPGQCPINVRAGNYLAVRFAQRIGNPLGRRMGRWGHV
jgi:hypothetical protein